jgi:long-subunit fatty acid transport protein
VRHLNRHLATVSTVFFLRIGAAHATTDAPAHYDARSVGMAGTGAAFIENGASVFLNPATLSGVKKYALTGDLTLSMPALSAPLGAGGASIDSSVTPFPLFLVGGAYRVTAGFGAAFKNLVALGGERLEMSLAQFEISPAASYAITDELSVGLGYRVTYTMEGAHLVQPAPTGTGLATTDLSLHGTNFLGAHIGVYYRPLSVLRFGITYLSKVASDLDGTARTNLVPGDLTARSKFSAPHQFGAEAAFSTLENRLLLAARFRYYLYSESNKDLPTTVDFPTGAVTSTQVLNWKNVAAGGLGAEYLVVPRVPVRIGYLITQSSVPKAYASPFLPPPGLLHAIHAGAGLRFTDCDVDLGGYYAFGSRTVSAAEADLAAGTIPGEYSIKNLVIAASFTYRPELSGAGPIVSAK